MTYIYRYMCTSPWIRGREWWQQHHITTKWVCTLESNTYNKRAYLYKDICQW